jgi:hypothetical protein
MVTATVTLTETEGKQLRALAQRTGKTEGQLLHEALRSLLHQPGGTDRQNAFQQARGMWRDRDDLPDFSQLRSELDRTGL